MQPQYVSESLDYVTSMDLDLRMMRYFVTLAEKLHFGRGAESLRISQPVLSRQIRQLERQVGAKLFERGPQKVTLTEAGQALLPEAYRILRAASTAVVRVRSAGNGEIGILRIGFLPAAGLELMPRIIRAYHARRPNVELVLTEMFEDEQSAALLDGDIDIGFMRSRIIPEFGQQQAGNSVGLYLVVPNSHALADRTEVDLKSLASENFIWWPAEVDSAWRDHYRKEAGFDLHVGQEARSITAIIGLVAAGLGVTLLAGEYLALGRPDITFIRVAGQQSHLTLAWTRTTALIDGFLETASELYGEHRSMPKRHQAMP